MAIIDNSFSLKILLKVIEFPAEIVNLLLPHTLLLPCYTRTITLSPKDEATRTISFGFSFAFCSDCSSSQFYIQWLIRFSLEFSFYFHVIAHPRREELAMKIGLTEARIQVRKFDYYNHQIDNNYNWNWNCNCNN